MGGEWRAEERWGRSRGFIPRRWTRCVVASTVTDWADGRCSLGGVVILVQWCDHEARALAMPTARRTVLVVVCKNRVAAELSGGLSVQGKGGTATWLRCLAGSCAAGKERVRARPGTRRTLSASTVRARRGQSTGCRATNGRRGRQQAIGHRRRWLGAAGGMVAGAGLSPAPWSARVSSGWPRASRERERGWGRAGTGRWGSRVHLGGGSMLIGGRGWLE
jgi:hypothetical protein